MVISSVGCVMRHSRGAISRKRILLFFCSLSSRFETLFAISLPFPLMPVAREVVPLFSLLTSGAGISLTLPCDFFSESQMDQGVSCPHCLWVEKKV